MVERIDVVLLCTTPSTDHEYDTVTGSPSGSLVDTKQLIFPVCAVGALGDRRILVMVGAPLPALTVCVALSVAPKGSAAVAVHEIWSPDRIVGRTMVSPVPMGEPLCSHAYVMVVLSLSGSVAAVEQVTTTPDSRPVLGEIVGMVTTGLRLARVILVDWAL